MITIPVLSKRINKYNIRLISEGIIDKVVDPEDTWKKAKGYRGRIVCKLDQKQTKPATADVLYLYFMVKPELDTIDKTFLVNEHIAVTYFPFDEMDTFIDVLRNEKTVYDIFGRNAATEIVFIGIQSEYRKKTMIFKYW